MSLKNLSDFLPLSGGYAIINKYTGRVYVGQSRNMVARWVSHVSDLQRQMHSNKQLQSDWDKYGAEGFSVQVISRCQPEYLLSEEQYCIKEYRSIAGVYNVGEIQAIYVV